MQRHDTPQLIGVVHLLPLPGSPHDSPGLAAVIARAVSDATALVDGGADGLIVENFGDAPFAGDRVVPYTISAMTVVAHAVREAAPELVLGINVLRNDALAALAVAAAVSAQFIRVNVHTGTMVTDQGVLTGTARTTLLERRRIGANVEIVADVLVKHAVPLGDQDAGVAARDSWHRGGANALIVTGTGTGQPIDIDRLIQVRAAVPKAPIWAGSGVNPDTVSAVKPHIDAAIVGTWLHRDGLITAPVEADRVERMRALLAQ